MIKIEKSMKISINLLLLVTILSISNVVSSEPKTALEAIQEVVSSEGKTTLEAIKESEQEYQEISDNRRDYLDTIELFSLDEDSLQGNYTLYEEVTDNRPVLGKAVKVYSGDAMLQQRTGMAVPCFIPKETWSKSYLGATFIIMKNKKICFDPKLSLYMASSYEPYQSSGSDFKAGIEVKEKKGKYKFGVNTRGITWVKKKAIEGEDFDSIVSFLSAPENFQRSIEYSGRSGSILSFIYSESINDFSRPASTREFSMDLDEGSEGGYKGVIFEVIEASNFEIVYKIKRQFQ